MIQTQSVVFESTDKVVVREIPMPDPGPGEVQLRTRFSVISAGTEGWVWQNRFTWQPTVYPCVPGYQRVAEVVRVGDGVEGWVPGDVAICTWGRWEGPVASMWGSHVAIANTPAAELYRLPEGISVEDAAGFVVAQVGYNAASRFALRSSDWIAVLGDGIIGQCAAQAARVRGANVVLVGRRPERLALAPAVGIHHVVNEREQNVVEAVRKITGAETVAGILDTIQTEQAQVATIDLLEHGVGQIVYSGFTPGTSWADMALLQQRELTTHFVCGWSRSRLEGTLALMATGEMSVAKLITHRVDYRKAPEMYGMIREKTEPFMAIGLEW